MATDRPSYLRAVESEKRPRRENPVALDWQCTPTSLAELELVVTEIQRAHANTPADTPCPVEIEHALGNIETALQEETIGLEIEQGTIRQNLTPLTNSFEKLAALSLALQSHADVWLQKYVHHVAELILGRITELARRSATGTHAAPNQAFRYALLNYATRPEYQSLIDERLFQSEEMLLPATLAERSEEQLKLEAIGKKLRGAHSTLELIERLQVVLPENEGFFINPNLYQRRLVSGSRALIKNIFTEVRTQGESGLEVAAILTKTGTPPSEISSDRLPILGNFSTASIVLPEIKREKEALIQAIGKQGGLFKIEDCRSWFHLLWYVFQEIDPAEKFAFSITNEDGVEEISQLTGRDIQTITENSALDRGLIKNLPGENTVRLLTPNSRFLPTLRAKLDDYLLS